MHDYEFGSCDVARLRFDPLNPRLPPGVDGHDDDQVLKWMLSDAGLIELIGSIGQNGFFPGDPLLIAPWPDEPDSTQARKPSEGKWVVVEGNRRLAAMTLLRDPTRASRRRKAVEASVASAKHASPDSVPVVTFPRRDDVLVYLGYRHITGVKQWDPLEKARYLTQLRERAKSLGDPFDNKSLARDIGSKAPYVGRLLLANALMVRLAEQEFFGQVEQDDVPFSVLTLALNYASIVEFIGLQRADDPDQVTNDARLRQLAEWLFVEGADGQTKLGDSRNMGLLARVVTNPAAVAALENGLPVRQAALLSEPAEEVLAVALDEAARRMRVGVEKAELITEPVSGAQESIDAIRTDAATIEDRLRAITRDQMLS